MKASHFWEAFFLYDVGHGLTILDWTLCCEI